MTHPSSGVDLEQKLIVVGQAIEEQLDTELERLDKLDDSDLEALRKIRLEEIKKKNSQKQDWINAGHGEYTELTNEREFFDASKRSPRLIIHFYVNTSENCRVVDKHFSLLCKKHLETRFCKMNAEKSPFLVDRLKVKMMPALIFVVDGQIVGRMSGFDALNVQSNDFPTELLESYLGRMSMLECCKDKDFGGNNSQKPCSAIFGLKQKDKLKKSIKGNDEDDSDDNDW